MFSTADTIVAIATPPGRGALGVVRLSGGEAARIARELTARSTTLIPRHATYARLTIPSSAGVGDEVIVTHFPAPGSATGEDCVEISAHGSPVVLAAILKAAVAAGARLAEPGEFTLRAFLNGKRDLVQAEAIADLVEAVTPLQARVAFDQLRGTLTTAIAAIESDLFDLVARLEASLDFPDEGYHFITDTEILASLDRVVARLDRLLADAARGRLVREGAIVTLAGRPNVGKSSLFNALLNTNRAIVTDVPGTTRDLLTERVDLEGLSLALVDTAGLRPTEDVVELEGVRRAEGSLAASDLVLVVLDRSRPLQEEDAHVLEVTRSRVRIVVLNKIDLPAAWTALPPLVAPEEAVDVSVLTGQGLGDLVRRITTRLTGRVAAGDDPLVTNVRHVALLQQTRSALSQARDALHQAGGALAEEFLLADIQDAHTHLQEITGRRTSDDVLRHIFERFCIGK